MRRSVVALVVPVVALLCGGCGSSGGSAASTTSARTSGTGTVWLCRPGQVPDPCTTPLATTVVPATGPRAVERPTTPTDPGFDCFYVYPTVSTEATDNADLEVQPAEIGVAASQASPVLLGLPGVRPDVPPAHAEVPGRGPGPRPHGERRRLRQPAFRVDRLPHPLQRRPPGHLHRALAGCRHADPTPVGPGRRRPGPACPDGVGHHRRRERDRAHRRGVGATFRHLPLCTSSGEDGCVIAYSTFPTEPPPDSLFGRPGTGVSLQSGQTATTGVQVACVNPGGSRRWHRTAHAVVPHRDPVAARTTGDDALGHLPRPLLGARARAPGGDLAPGHHPAATAGSVPR